MPLVKFSHQKLWIIRVINSNQGQRVLDLWHARVWHLRERRIIMTIVKSKFQERSWLRRKRHNFKPGSSVDEIMIQTNVCSPLQSQGQGQIPPCTSLSQISESRPLSINIYYNNINTFKHTDLREELNKGGVFCASKVHLSKCKDPWTLCDVLNQNFLYSTPNPSWACYFQFFESTTFVVSIQTFSREWELSTVWLLLSSEWE